jgi:hypothetical protein
MELSMISETETMVQSWYHVHLLSEKKSTEKYTSRCNDWLVGIHCSLQQHLKQQMERLHLSAALDASRDGVKGPRDFRGPNSSLLLRKAKSEERTALYGPLKRDLAYGVEFSQANPAPPSRTSTKKYKVQSSKSATANDTVQEEEEASQEKPSRAHSPASQDSAKTLCNDLVPETKYEEKTQRPKQPPISDRSGWKKVLVPKLMVKPELPARPKLEQIVLDTQKVSSPPRRTKSMGSTAAVLRTSLSAFSKPRGPDTTPQVKDKVKIPIEIKVPNVIKAVASREMGDSFPKVHLPGMYDQEELECDCAYSHHDYVGVTGLTLLYYLFHVALVISLVTGSRLPFVYKLF